MPTRLPRCASAIARFTAKRRLADAALAGANRDDVLHARGPARVPAVAVPRRADAGGHGHLDDGDAWNCDTAARAWSRIWSFTGQAGVVNWMVNATRPPSIVEVLDEAQRDDVAVEVGILNAAERVEHGGLVDGRHGHLTTGLIRLRPQGFGGTRGSGLRAQGLGLRTQDSGLRTQNSNSELNTQDSPLRPSRGRRSAFLLSNHNFEEGCASRSGLPWRAVGEQARGRGP